MINEQSKQIQNKTGTKVKYNSTIENSSKNVTKPLQRAICKKGFMRAEEVSTK